MYTALYSGHLHHNSSGQGRHLTLEVSGYTCSAHTHSPDIEAVTSNDSERTMVVELYSRTMASTSQSSRKRQTTRSSKVRYGCPPTPPSPVTVNTTHGRESRAAAGLWLEHYTFNIHTSIPSHSKEADASPAIGENASNRS